jgi:hypothetical protein
MYCLLSKDVSSSFQYPARILSVCWQDIANMLQGYSMFAGSILITRRERFSMLSGELGENILSGFKLEAVLEKIIE